MSSGNGIRDAELEPTLYQHMLLNCGKSEMQANHGGDPYN